MLKKSALMIFCFTISIKSLNAAAVEIPVTGTAVVYNDEYSAASPVVVDGAGKSFKTDNFLWHRHSCPSVDYKWDGLGCNGGMVNQSGNHFVSYNWLKRTPNFNVGLYEGWTKRTMLFSIQGKSPGLGYKVVATQTMDLKTVENDNPAWARASTWVRVGCGDYMTIAKQDFSTSNVATTQLSGKGQTYLGVQVTAKYEIAPGACPSNVFYVDVTSLGQEMTFHELEVLILENGTPL